LPVSDSHEEGAVLGINAPFVLGQVENLSISWLCLGSATRDPILDDTEERGQKMRLFDMFHFPSLPRPKKTCSVGAP
jgi:hypothetical protein